MDHRKEIFLPKKSFSTEELKTVSTNELKAAFKNYLRAFSIEELKDFCEECKGVPMDERERDIESL